MSLSSHICYIIHISQASDEETYDLVREGVVIFTGALAKHLSKVQMDTELSLFKTCMHCTKCSL